ncbi:MAG: hypothetical protein GTN67_01905 [Hydrotalea flava]|jgi:hypothetical protein|uniref:hypothetical protein n=1 Tax=Chitinophaga TaxID=79328 RepID=UPI0009294A85|nr:MULTISPECIES: hypothetical protein [Chitinophaga]MBD3748631.1 hypothetical protein [Sphingobacteriales bacterium]NIM34246.1 hypothetical protein [Hydrotalea flava]OJW42334.1 MAG: hypothetical protein BGO56_10905 [Sphingobacteriales bacterium 48-107]ASZ09626.1 hypothetical protein CK934_00860 [Chitinophaga sp. MD30]NIM37070.1 hypothetical protein [Hydrotalea flava]
MDENKLLEVCFMLAEDLMWDKDSAPIERLPEDISELNEMTNKFIEIANQNYYQVEGLPDGDEILIGAIRYLNVQAIPPLRGNYAWFANSLSTLLEICNPNSIVRSEGIPFLLSLQKGIIKHLEWATKSDEEEES